MAIWFGNYQLSDIATLKGARSADRNLATHLGIEFTALGEDFLQGRMPVDDRTKQTYGILHGGASVALAETLGSVGANLTIDPERFNVVGQEINANHVRAVNKGYVIGTARPLHVGKRSQVWEIRIEDEAQRLVCISRLTLAVLERASIR
jgi:1,4-dihydroxy-2-naphthoyl-CoA hydrolase